MNADRTALICRMAGGIVISLIVVSSNACKPTQEYAGAPDDILTNGTKLYSQFNEELIVRHFFDDRRDGFYIDVGCYHWEKGSTTAYLEKHLGWSGFAFDAQPTLAEGWKKHRPKAKFFNYIVTDHSGGSEPFFVAGALSSVNQDHIRQFPHGDEIKPKQIMVPTITLNDVLDREGITKVDFVSMDIEAGEPPALRGFDIERFKPDMVCVEAAVAIRPAILAYFKEHNYEIIDEYLEHDGVNWYFRPAS